MSEIVKQKTSDYWECDRCKINSFTKDRMIPCPRRGCEAEAVGTITKTITLEKTVIKNETTS